MQVKNKKITNYARIFLAMKIGKEV